MSFPTKFRSALVAGVQTGVAAALAWWIATLVLPTEVPSYAPVAAVAVLGAGYDRRLVRVQSMLGGMAAAILVTEIAVRVLPSGVVSLAVVTALAIVGTRLLFDDTLAVVYAGFNAPILFGVGGDGWVPDRGLEAVIGVATAFALLYLVFPPQALRFARRAIDRQTSAAVDSLRLASSALDPSGSHEPIEADDLSAAIDRNLDAMSETFGFSFEVARFSPWRWQDQSEVEAAVERARRLQPFLRASTSAVRTASRLATAGPDAHLSGALASAADLVEVVGEVARGGSGGAVEAKERATEAWRRIEDSSMADCDDDEPLRVAVAQLVRLVGDDGRDLVTQL